MAVKATAAETAVQRKRMSYEAYLDFAGETQIAEWVDGEVITYMPPIEMHQDVVGFLYALMRSFVTYLQLGRVFVAPFEVKLWPDGPSREPDVLFIGADKLPNLTVKRFNGAPDLVIEVLSASSVTEDRVRKFKEYEQAGVREYWIADPRPFQQQADFFVRGDEGVFVAAAVDENGRYHSHVLPHLWLDLRRLQQDPLPNPQFAFADIMCTAPDLPDHAGDTFRALRDLLGER